VALLEAAERGGLEFVNAVLASIGALTATAPLAGLDDDVGPPDLFGVAS
jgi:hypothetical protein